MRYYFAPLEGVTDSIYRRLHHKYFPGIDKYFTPFFSPTVHRQLTPREQRELPPADSIGYKAIPQLLTKNADDFLWMARQCRDLGYKEVNLNLGCPSGTVTAKGKGAGMLRDPEALDAFLSRIFECAPLDISVKTRIGFTDPGEFETLISVFNRYPIYELTVHPRVRDAFYKGTVNMDVFSFAEQNSRAPLCYNGNLCSREHITAFQKQFPNVQAVMLGRGLIADGGMLCPEPYTAATLEAFYNELLEEYLSAFGGSRNAMFRLKEHWRYLQCKFEGSEKLYKKLRKTTSLAEYKQLTSTIFHALPLKETVSADW